MVNVVVDIRVRPDIRIIYVRVGIEILIIRVYVSIDNIGVSMVSVGIESIVVRIDIWVVRIIRIDIFTGIIIIIGAVFVVFVGRFGILQR